MKLEEGNPSESFFISCPFLLSPSPSHPILIPIFIPAGDPPNHRCIIPTMNSLKCMKKNAWSNKTFLLIFHFFLLFSSICVAQDYVGDDNTPGAAATGDNDVPAKPREEESCDGIFLSYTFIRREKEFPHLKNATAQAWAFKSIATVLNAGAYELKAWKMFVGFQHDEILVSVGGAVILDGGDFPAPVGNGTVLSGFPQTDLKTSIDTAGDLDQIQVKIEISGTQFGIKPPGMPMPETIKLENDGYKCPKPTKHASNMFVCCKRDPKLKAKAVKKTKFLPRQNGDLSLVYDVLQANEGKYQAQVTIDNLNLLGRLDHWNLTWEWMKGEFIYSIRGAYTHKKDISECLFGPASKYYKDFDFSNVMNCEKKPIIADLPADRAKDEKIGNIPFCCTNGTLLPKTMDASKSKAVFQLEVFKSPPDMNRTALTPPQNWKINGVLNPNYKCGAPIRIDPTEFPDPSGLQAITISVASWQVVCNITRPKLKEPSKCCVSFSAFYNDSVIPCNSCACGCDDEKSTCNAKLDPLLLPSESLLVPFDNRTAKAKAWAKIKNYHIPNPLPCPDNCGVSINWHLNSDYKTGWTARITLFNWAEIVFEDWFTAIQMAKAYPGYENIYSFNGTKLPQLENTIFFQGLPGLNYLVGEVNGTNPEKDPRVPGKQQSVISFTKKQTPGIKVRQGDGFPARVFFNGEECSIPTRIPTADAGRESRISLIAMIFIAIITFVLITDRFH